MSHETVLYVTKDGHAKAVRIMATVGENLVSTGKDTTSQQLQIARQYTWWYSQALTYQTLSTKLVSGIQDLASNTGHLQFNDYSE
jgi:hypothetical protein